MTISGRGRVLVVDDNQDAARMLASVLGHLGWTVTVAHDGDAALTAAERDHPDLALLDIGLPGMDGYALAEALRARWPSVRLVAVSGYGRDEGRAEAFEAWLVKPVDMERLTVILGQA